jgi:hypothetical protein
MKAFFLQRLVLIKVEIIWISSFLRSLGITNRKYELWIMFKQNGLTYVL